MTIKTLFKSKLFYIRLLSAVTIILSFIPFCNPITAYDGEKHGALITAIGNMGSVVKYFSTEMPGFKAFTNILFILVILIYVGLIGVLFGLLLTFSHDKTYNKNGINSILYSSILLLVVFVVLSILYLNINWQMYSYGSVAVYRKLLVLLRIPVFLYVFGVISFALFVLTMVQNGFSLHALKYSIESYFAHRFVGGVHVPYNKVTRKMPIEKIPPAKIMVYPISQHIGASCQSLVKVGDTVTVGQKIADTDAYVSAPVHSSVSGKVIRIGEEPHPTQNKVLSIVVENDFLYTPCENIGAVRDNIDSLTTDQLLSIIREAGITGMGGACFPTHVKIQSALKDNIDTLIINAAECEPYLSNDNRLLIENTDEVIEGIQILKKIFGLKTAFIGIESNKPRAIKKLNRATYKKGIEVEILHAKYPQGGEKQLIKSVCNRVVPAGKLPSSVGCCILNVDTVAAIYRAVALSTPVIRRIVTVAGDGVEKAGNYHIHLGTPFSHVLEHCGLKPETNKIIMGGPMMGTAQYSLDVPVVKGTSGILCFIEDEQVEGTSCIRCGSCVSACPMRLVPNYIAQYAKLNNFDECEKLSAADCIECGCCSYTCPAKIPLTQYMRLAKQSVIEKRKKEGSK